MLWNNLPDICEFYAFTILARVVVVYTHTVQYTNAYLQVVRIEAKDLSISLQCEIGVVFLLCRSAEHAATARDTKYVRIVKTW